MRCNGFTDTACTHLSLPPLAPQVKWNANKTEILFGTRKAPYWDTGFVESAMPPLKLSDGNLLFFYDSVGPWNGTSGAMPST